MESSIPKKKAEEKTYNTHLDLLWLKGNAQS